MREREENKNQIFQTEVVGCDGCLNPDGMGIDMMEYYNTDKNQFNGPDVTLTNNNGLLYVADILEEIYTNKDFPDLSNNNHQVPRYNKL